MAAVLALTVLLSACSGDGDDKPSLPLPDKAPSERGPATGPALEAKVLLAASDDLDAALGGLDSAHVERRAGAFIAGNTAIGYSVDDVSGYDLESGQELWTAKLDMGGGTVCFASEPDADVKTFTVVYGESGFCNGLAIIRVSDGKVMSNVDTLGHDDDRPGGDKMGHPISYLLTVGTDDYVIDNGGVVWTFRTTESDDDKPASWTKVTTLRDRSYFDLYPTPDGTQLIGSRLGGDPECHVDAYDLPSFKHQWTKTNADLFPGTGDDCVIALARGNPAWMTLQDGEMHHLIQVDPATGDVLGKTQSSQATDAPKVPAGELDADYAALLFDSTLGLADGDMIFASSRGIIRYSLADGEFAWDLDLSQFELETTDRFDDLEVLPQGITDDGYVVATVTNGTAAEVVAVTAESGKLVGRWPVPAEYRNGFQIQPDLTLFENGLVLTRNFKAWNYEFEGAGGQEAPEGSRFDIGVFTFPDPNSVQPEAVPTVGPTDNEATWLGGMKTTEAETDPGGSAVGDRLIVDLGSTIEAWSATSGKRLWSADLPATGQTCAMSDLDDDSTTATVVYKLADDAKCLSLVTISLTDGKVGSPIPAPSGTSFFSVLTHDTKDYVLSTNGRVDEVTSAGLREVAEFDRSHNRLQFTPEDPDLVVALTSIKDGKDWIIDAYRLPSFDKVWSTRASKVFDKVDKRNQVIMWWPNGLWLMTTIGDLDDPDTKADDVLVHLDAETGKPVWSSGRIERDYLADDPADLSLISAGSSSWSGVGFADGDLIIEQPKTIARLSAAGEFDWVTDISSIRNSMERDNPTAVLGEQYGLIDGGKTILVTLHNGTSVEFMTLTSSTGTVTGRWKVPVKYRNGLQGWPSAVGFNGSVALLSSRYGWNSEFGPEGDREPPKTTRYDLGIFALDDPSDD